MCFILLYFPFKMSVFEAYDNYNKIIMHYKQNVISRGNNRLKGYNPNGLIISTQGPVRRTEATWQNTTYAAERKSGYVDTTKESVSTGKILTFSFDEVRDLYSQLQQTRSRHNMINCSKIVIDGDLLELSKAQQTMKESARPALDVTFFKNISNCGHFKKQRGYITHQLSEKESNFPIAFSLIVYKDIEQVERLLRAIFRPQNMYCVHIDLKATTDFIIAINTITKCFENVFIAPELLNVTWGTFSVLEAEMVCLRKLLNFKKWKYFINLTGQEFPLKTNKELVEILEALDGANVVDGTLLRPSMYDFHRWTLARKPPPHKIRPVKGSVHVAINR
ncbi:hypothetical protein DPMN_129084 [Dreissena polymorpha]|uniref:Beta-1,3-galactosyl-O-glycosyl-glycoprotein beta-1,6-N-acetylglucosaminyltransferase n=3 Tax=Dreissena polymorpha TaxID=45954 RepID=A0A9D4H231_DREPO|nr:hypothetical protein DPMN_129084 [Dreissena polymorpha]